MFSRSLGCFVYSPVHHLSTVLQREWWREGTSSYPRKDFRTQIICPVHQSQEVLIYHFVKSALVLFEMTLMSGSLVRTPSFVC